MASTVLKCAILAFLMVSLVIAQRGQGLYPEGHRRVGRPEYVPTGKAGHCAPSGDRRSNYRGGRNCRRDEDCPDLDKCCDSNGRKICVPPVFA